MKLEPGLYKVKSGSGILNKPHLLRIWREKGKLYYQMDHGIPVPIDKADPVTIIAKERLDQLRILKHYASGELQVRKARAVITATDIDGDEFEFAAMNVHALRRIFLEFPDIARYLGVRLKKNTSGSKN